MCVGTLTFRFESVSRWKPDLTKELKKLFPVTHLCYSHGDKTCIIKFQKIFPTHMATYKGSLNPVVKPIKPNPPLHVFHFPLFNICHILWISLETSWSPWELLFWVGQEEEPFNKHLNSVKTARSLISLKSLFLSVS